MRIDSETIVRLSLTEREVCLLVRRLRGDGGNDIETFAEEFINELQSATPLKFDPA